MPEPRQLLQLEPLVVDELFRSLIRTLNDRGWLIQQWSDGGECVLSYGRINVIVRRAGGLADPRVLLYGTGIALDALVPPNTDLTGRISVRHFLTIEMAAGPNGMVGWRTSKSQSIPHGPLEIGFIIERRVDAMEIDEQSH